MAGISIIKINNKTLPTPARGMGEQWAQIVDSARNANGVVVAQKIGRRQLKLDGVVWPALTAKEWGDILKEIDKFTGSLEVFDPRQGGKRTIQVYWGDASAEPYYYDKNGNVELYINCKCNIIDLGK